MYGFFRILKEESSPDTREHMLDYLIALLDDPNDFSWQSAKASHRLTKLIGLGVQVHRGTM